MGGILEAVEVPGFLANEELLEEAAKGSEGGLMAFVEAWYKEHGTNAVFQEDLFHLASHYDNENPLAGAGRPKSMGLLDELLKAGAENGRKAQLGKLLNMHHDKVFGAYKIVRGKKPGNKQQWYLSVITPATDSPDQLTLVRVC